MYTYKTTLKSIKGGLSFIQDKLLTHLIEPTYAVVASSITTLTFTSNITLEIVTLFLLESNNVSN